MRWDCIPLSRVQGNKLKAKAEIRRVATVFRNAPEPFLHGEDDWRLRAGAPEREG